MTSSTPPLHVLRRPTAALVAAALIALAACSGDGGDAAGHDTTTRPSTTTSTTSAPTPEGEPVDDLLLTAADLPPGFEPAAEVDDTITSFCVSEDATAGLSASARAVAGFAREPPGMSVVQLVFRFDDGGAATFVQQADAILDRCHEVPDFSGLAFAYEAPSPAVAAALEGTDASTARYGRSIGSEQLTLDVAVFAHGDVGQLVAVLGLDADREELDAVAAQAFTTAVERSAAPA